MQRPLPRPQPSPPQQPTPPDGLTREQKLDLFTNGYLILPNAVSPDLVNSALRLINQELGFGLSKQDMEEGAKGTYCKRIAASAPIGNLFNASSVLRAVQQLIPETTPLWGGQIALRFPGQICTDKENFIPAPWWSSSWHVDGFADENNGITAGEIRNFTTLVGVALSDAPKDFCGNLVVYPRSHWILQKFFRENGFDEVKKGLAHIPGLQLPPPVQVHLKTGDVVIAHYMLAHSIAPNTSPNIRYQVYFRVNIRPENVHHPEPMLEIWKDWKGMKDIVETEKEVQVVGSGDVVKPYYADQRRKQDLAQQLLMDEKFTAVKAQAEALFEQHKMDLAQEPWAQLAAHYTNDWVIQLKAALVFVLGTNDAKVAQGEPFCKNLIALSPLLAVGFCIYCANLRRQKRYAEAVQMAKKVLEIPPSADKDQINGLLDSVVDSMLELNTDPAEMTQYLKKLAEVYPQFQEKILQTEKEIAKKQLWKKGTEWLHAPQKDLVEGEGIWLQIITIDPTDFWATLLYGGCLSWNKKLVEGETYIRKAIQLNDTVPNGFALLAQNQLWQGKHQIVLGVVKGMMQRKFPTVETDADHREKIFEALECLKQVSGLISPDFKNAVAQACIHYPSLKNELNNFERTGKR